MTQSIELLLADDHQAIDDFYEAYLIAKSKSLRASLPLFENYKASLLRHIKCEEDLIFPLLKRAEKVKASAEVPVLHEEHIRFVPLLMEIQRQLNAGTDPADTERHLFEELHDHNAREELKVYGFIEPLLDESQEQAIRSALLSKAFFSKA